ARGMRRRRGRARRHGLDHAAAQQTWGGRDAGRGRGAARRCRDPAGTPGRRCSGASQETARWFIAKVGRHRGTALQGSRGEVSGRPEADTRLKLALPARAKLNLDLEVLGRNAAGFHDLRTTFQAIALHDLLEIETAPETGFTTSGLPVSAEKNSVLLALRTLEQAAHRSLPSRIHLDQRIPPGSRM